MSNNAKKNSVKLADPPKSIDKIVVIPKSPKPKVEFEKDEAIESPLRRSRSDGELYNRHIKDMELNSLTEPGHWQRLVDHLKLKRIQSRVEQSKILMEALQKSKKQRRKSWGFFRRLSCLFTGPMFYRHRYWFIIFLEVFLPVFVFLFASWSFTSGVSWKIAYGDRKAAKEYIQKHGAEMKETAMNQVIGKFHENFVSKQGNVYIAFSPSTNFTQSLMKDVIRTLKLDEDAVRVIPEGSHSSMGATGVSDATEVLEHCLLHRYDTKVHSNPIGIEFRMKNIDDATKLPLKLKFVIRTFDKRISNTLSQHPFVQPPRKGDIGSDRWLPPYVETGFLALQYAIQHAFLVKVHQALYDKTNTQLDSIADPKQKMKILGGLSMDPTNKVFPEITFKTFFTPNYFDDYIRHLASVLVCFLLCFSYIGLSYFIVRQLVIENNSKIKDLLAAHHMDKYLHWVIYLCHALFFRTITAAGITMTLYINYGNGAIFTHSNWIIIYILIFTHLMSLSFFNFLISTLLKSVIYSGIFSVTICIFSFILPHSLLEANLLGDLSNFILAIVFPNWALWNCIVDIINLECDNIGANWSNFWKLIDGRTSVTYVQSLIIFIVPGTIYFFAAMFLDLIPSDSELSRFACIQRLLRRNPKEKETKTTKSKTSMKSSNSRLSVVRSSEQGEGSYKPRVYERPEPSSRCLVRIRHLSRAFNAYKLALDDVTLDLVHGEITVVLGCANSGKSTLLQCVAGVCEPTNGQIVIDGIDLYQNKKKAKEYIGYCPQDIIVFNVLSVQEHLVLCYKLQGLSTKEAKNFAEGLMELLRITDVRNFTPSSLTEDERRKLAIALCLVEKPSIILLDEVTVGMEPLTRHEIWNILTSLKTEGHTIVLTTSLMDEAEFLADRIILLAQGKLICYGTPKFLKERYSVGYYLRITPNPAKFTLDGFQAFAKKHFDQALQEAPEKTPFDQRNFVLVLPKAPASTMIAFFNELEDFKFNLGVAAYGTHTTTLSDIFVKVSSYVSVGHNTPDFYDSKTEKNKNSHPWGEIPVNSKETRDISKKKQFKIMTQKLWLHGIEGKTNLIYQVIFPLCLIWIVVWQTRAFVVPPPSPVEREFLLSTFPNARVYFRETGTIYNEMHWKNHLQEILGNQGEELKEDEDLEQMVQSQSDEERKLQEYDIEKRMIAIELIQDSSQRRTEVEAYYSSGSLHSPPLVLSVVGNLFLRSVANKTIPAPKFELVAANIPFPSALESEFGIDCGFTCLMFGLVISFSVGFFSTLLMSFPVQERVNGMKQLQYMCGVYPWTYWFATYFYHFLLCAILSVGVVGIFLLDFNSVYTGLPTIVPLFAIVGTYLCWSVVPWVYYLTTIVPLSIEAQLFGLLIHLCLSFAPMIILETKLVDVRKEIDVLLRYFFHLFPPYTLTAATYNFLDVISKRSLCKTLPEVIRKMCVLDDAHVGENALDEGRKQIFKYMASKDVNLAKCCEKICKPTDTCSLKTPFFGDISTDWEKPKLTHCFVALVFQGLLYWAILMIVESNVITDYWHNLVLKFLSRKQIAEDPRECPPDILKEKEAAEGALENEKCREGVLMVCQELTKSYTERMVIDDVDIALKKGEIVSLVGGGGCGKSVVIRMIAGSVTPTRGTVVIDSNELHRDRREFLRGIGYCPQEDALFETLTGTQMLELMGKLRGIPGSDLSNHVKQWVDILGLTEGAKDKCSTYNKSMRRRLSVGMACIGGNPILLFDEPTRSLDAISKQRIWSIFQQVADQGHGVIYTSHHVNECELNATKLFVLSEGNVQCIGTPEELRYRYSRGFSFLIRVRFDKLTPLEIISSTIGRVNDLKKTIEKKIKRAILRDEQGDLLLYFLDGHHLTLGTIFTLAEEIKAEHKDIVENYYISQATLDDVFVLLTNRYKDMDTAREMNASPPEEPTHEEVEAEAFREANQIS